MVGFTTFCSNDLPKAVAFFVVLFVKPVTGLFMQTDDFVSRTVARYMRIAELIQGV